MLQARVDTIESGNWQYNRHVFHSKELGQEFHCGIFRSLKSTVIDTTLYLLHGGDGDDLQAVQAGLLTLLSDFLNSRNLHNVQVALPSIGTSFLQDSTPAKSYSHYFLQELVPACEAETKTRPESRFIAGWSMGGQSALNMFFRAPELFAGVGAHFPTLIDFDYTDKTQCENYAHRQNVSAPMIKILAEGFQKEFLDFQAFTRHDPLRLANALPPSQLGKKKIYFDVGQEDEFGLSEGARALHKICEAKGVAHQFEVVPQGKHDGAFIHGQLQKLLQHLL